MAVKFFGQFLIDEGEVDAGHVREALDLMDRENATLGQLAVKSGYMSGADVMRVQNEQRVRDQSFGDLSVDLGLLESEQLVDLLRRQRMQRLPIGEALVRLGHLPHDRLGLMLDAFKSDQAEYEIRVIELPDGLANHRVTRYVLDLLPRFLMRVAQIHAKLGEIRDFDGEPDFATVRVSVPIQGVRGLEVALVSDRAFAEAVAIATSGLDREALDDELMADGVGEFLNVLAGNAASAIAREGHRAELGPPDYQAEICDGWTVDLVVGVGSAALVLSTF